LLFIKKKKEKLVAELDNGNNQHMRGRGEMSQIEKMTITTQYQETVCN